MIEYRDHVEGVSPKDLVGFFENWPKLLTPQQHLELLRSSAYVIIALKERKVIGFVNAISDGLLTVYIPLLEVLPEYRKMGIGSELMKRVLEKCNKYYMIDLSCDEQFAPFYEKLGMKRGVAFYKRNYTSL